MSCCGGKMTVSKVAHGAAGLAKAAAQVVGVPVDVAPYVLRTMRRDICRGCDQSTGSGLLWFCKSCNCELLAKTRLKSETCCDSKW